MYQRAYIYEELIRFDNKKNHLNFKNWEKSRKKKKVQQTHKIALDYISHQGHVN